MKDEFTQYGQSTGDIDQKLSGRFAACVFDGTLTGVNYPLNARGIRKVERTAAGTYVLVFDKPMRDAEYVVVATPSQLSATTVDAKEAAKFTVTTWDTTLAAAVDTNEVNVIAFYP